MTDYHDLLEARIALFDRYLKLMVERQCEETESECFIVFMEEPPNSPWCKSFERNCVTPPLPTSNQRQLSATRATERSRTS